MSTHLAISRNLAIALLLVTGSALLLCAYSGFSAEMLFMALAGLALLSYLIVRFPEWFLVAALFAPQWKTFWVLQTLDRIADLTIVMLLCLAAGIIWRVLTLSGRANFWNLRTIFFGQLTPLVAFLIFAAIVATSYSYTDAPDYGASKLVRFLVIGTLLLIAPFFLILNEDDFTRFARIFVGFAAATAVQLVSSLELRPHDESVDITRIGSGWLIGMAIILVLFYPLARKSGTRRALYFLVLPILIVGLVASAARGPMVAVMVAVLLGLGTLLKQHRMQSGTATILLFVIIAGIGGAYLVLRQADVGKYTAKADEFETLFKEGSSTGSAGKRLNFYRATLNAIPSHLLFGTGVGSWSMFYYRSDTRGYPHNLVLEMLFEEGLIGLTAFGALLFVTGVSIARMLRASHSYFLALGLMVTYCVIVSMFSGDLDDNRVIWLWIGVTLAVCRTVHLQMAAGRAVRRTLQQATAGNSPSNAVPTFSNSFAVREVSDPKRRRSWREKYVY